MDFINSSFPYQWLSGGMEHDWKRIVVPSM